MIFSTNLCYKAHRISNKIGLKNLRNLRWNEEKKEKDIQKRLETFIKMFTSSYYI